jgi:hypothetical protein
VLARTQPDGQVQFFVADRDWALYLFLALLGSRSVVLRGQWGSIRSHSLGSYWVSPWTALFMVLRSDPHGLDLITLGTLIHGFGLFLYPAVILVLTA